MPPVDLAAAIQRRRQAMKQTYPLRPSRPLRFWFDVSYFALRAMRTSTLSTSRRVQQAPGGMGAP